MHFSMNNGLYLWSSSNFKCIDTVALKIIQQFIWVSENNRFMIRDDICEMVMHYGACDEKLFI